jgi:hypothetical protein
MGSLSGGARYDLVAFGNNVIDGNLPIRKGEIASPAGRFETLDAHSFWLTADMLDKIVVDQLVNNHQVFFEGPRPQAAGKGSYCRRASAIATPVALRRSGACSLYDEHFARREAIRE